MARFNVGDRVMLVDGGDVRTVVQAVPDNSGRIVLIDADGDYRVGHEQHYEPVPPPDPRDAVVEAAVAWADAYGMVPDLAPLSVAVVDAVQAWKAAQ